MSRLKSIEVVAPDGLTGDDIAAWESFTARRPDMIGPYFDVRYVMDIGQSVPDAYVARLRDETGEVAGFLPYQMRGRTLQPLGAPLTDYHGIIGEAGLEVDYSLLLKTLKADRLEFQGWVGGMAPRARTLSVVSQIADLSEGYDAYFARQKALHHKFYKNLGRCGRNAERDFGGFQFSFERVTPDLLQWVIDQKREQYARSGMHDVFGCGWTLKLLSQLAHRQDEGFGLRVGVLREGNHLVAAEICLMRGDYIHFWFPAYAEAYHRYSPGIILALKIMEHGAAMGVTRVDFGAGGESYKHTMTSPAQTCLEGVVTARPHILSAVGDMMENLSPRLKGLRLSLRRRLRVIRACETCPKGRRHAFQALMRRGFDRLRQSPVNRAVTAAAANDAADL
ncbi:GNAT family N-acetyltransferase [Asticcacaulis sp. BYS171W]|uniref:GNAT family N-acetyltransferase n=1 Tax=Asticcacaulis aquaticus TaxID=2984212 RepID=A0ABT5HQI6_9CAUL|nr:GNAT family N-acetyltransferase [Asticcacaulis aquaticus]MDC7682331.1 GNAT family N-acetyltransferase [Asticcacaulis aquaticus]